MRFTPAFSLLATAMLLAACNDNSHTAYTPAPEGSQTLAQPSAQPVTQPPVVPAAPPVVTPPKPIKIGVVSDVHIFDSVRLGGVVGQPAYEAALAKDRKALLQSQALLDAALDKLVAAGNQVILVTGDLTKDGEQFSHEAFRAAIAKVQAKGVKVLLVPGNHDMNNPYGQHGSIYFEQNSLGAEVGSLAPFMEHVSGAKQYNVASFDEFYADFGFKGAVARDQSSFSYVTEPVPGLWVMALDIANTSLPDAPAKWATPEGETDYPRTGGSLLAPERQATFAWVKQMALRAKAEGKVLLTMSHFGGIEHFPGQNSLIPDYVIDGGGKASYLKRLSWKPYMESYTKSDGSQGALGYNSSSEYISAELAKAGIPLLFTGHFHANDIAQRRYADGSFLIDVETGATVSYPASYRQLELDLSQQTLTIHTDSQQVQEAVPEAALETLVDDMASNLPAALGMELPDQLLQLMNGLLLKRPLWDLMRDLYLFGQNLDPVADKAQGEQALLATLPTGVTQAQLQQQTLTTLIAKVLKAHYQGDEASNPAISAADRYAILWAKGVDSQQLAALLALQVAAMKLTLPPTVLPQFAALVTGFGLVGDGILHDPTPDLAVQIDLKTGVLQAK